MLGDCSPSVLALCIAHSARSLKLTSGCATKKELAKKQIPMEMSTYDHRVWRTGLPVRSAVLKPHAGRLVVGWVTTSESRLLYVSFFALTRAECVIMIVALFLFAVLSVMAE